MPWVAMAFALPSYRRSAIGMQFPCRRDPTASAPRTIVRLQQPSFGPSKSASPVEISRVSFKAPLQEYRNFVGRLDRHVAGYDGEGLACLDREPVAFERVAGDPNRFRRRKFARSIIKPSSRTAWHF